MTATLCWSSFAVGLLCGIQLWMAWRLWRATAAWAVSDHKDPTPRRATGGR